MFGVLEVALRHHPVAAAGRVAAELEIFLEQLLRRAADAQVRPVAVEDMVAVERNTAARGGAARRRRHPRRRRPGGCVHACVSCSFVAVAAFLLQPDCGGAGRMRAARGLH